MTRITNADQVLLLLRSHLERAKKARKRERPIASAGRATAQPTALQRVEQLASGESLSDSELRRALIAGLLTEEFGVEVSNDPKFSQIVDATVEALKADPHSAALLQAAMDRLSKPAS